MKLKPHIRLLFSVLLVQLLISQIFRFSFILLARENFSLTLTLKSLWYGLQFDLGIGLILCFLLILIQFVFRLFHSEKTSIKTTYYLFLILVIVQSIFVIGDIVLYRYWDSIFNIRAYAYLSNIKEMFRNVSTHNILQAIGFVILIGIVFHKLFKFFVSEPIAQFHNAYLWHWHLFITVLLIPISFLVLRGGFREIPRNQSDGYFCSERLYNMATINSTWNFFNVLVENDKFLEKNPYKKMSDEEVDMYIRSLYSIEELYSVNLFKKIDKPNIVLITMEGVSAEVFKMHNKNESHMPFLESIIDSSYYFSNAFSVGSRTEQGIAALLSGTLSTPFNNITDNVSNLHKLPSILTSFNQRDYSTNFFFGGNVEFANMRAYLSEMGFDSIIDILDFEPAKRKQSLGVPDEYLFDKLGDFLEKARNPFFVQVMTLSTHEPFDIPGSKNLENERDSYLKTVHYLDRQVEKFMYKYSKMEAFKNTIFVISSDHSHSLPEDVDIASPKRYHIPFIVYSPLLKNEYKGYRDSSLFAQQNFPATLSHLLNWDEKNYLFTSKSHFSNAPKFTFSSFVNGYLFQSDSFSISYDYIWRPYDTTDAELVRRHSYPQAIMQYTVDQIRGARKIR